MKASSPVGPNLRRLRLARGLTQDQLGEAAGITGQTVANVETQRVKAPQERVLQALAAALEVEVAEFYAPIPPSPAELPELLRTFVDEQGKRGKPLTEAEIQELAEHKFRGRPTLQTYAFLLAAIRETE